MNLRELKKAYSTLEYRPAIFAGRSYSSNPQKLENEIKASLARFPAKPTDPISLLVTPHIDYQRGENVYAKTYQYLNNCFYDLIIVLGIVHQQTKTIFHLTRKDFQTPLGLFKTDTESVEYLLANCDSLSIEEEYQHLAEHSIELQLPYLKHLCPHAKLLPILVGSFHKFFSSSPQQFREYTNFAQNLSLVIKQQKQAGKKVLIVSAVDMAHIGMFFDEEQPLSSNQLIELEKLDREYLNACIKKDPEELFRHIAKNDNNRNICGYPSLYLALDILNQVYPNSKITLVEYQQAVDWTEDCCVSFAGLYADS